MSCHWNQKVISFALIVLWVGCSSISARGDDKPAKSRRSNASWNKEIRRLVAALSTHQSRQAAYELANITDERALKLIRRKLPAADEPYVRQALMEPLARSGDEESIGILVRVAVEDSFEENRQLAIEHLQLAADADTVSERLIGYLQRNQFVNQAAYALHEGGFVRAETGPYLITRLFEEQRMTIQTVEYGQQVMDPCVDAVLNRPRLVNHRVKIPFENPMVYQTLKEYSGKDFGHDLFRWRAWAKEHADSLFQSDAPPRPLNAGQ